MKNYWLDRIDLKTCREVAARIWCDQKFKKVVMDADACEKIARILFKVANGNKVC